MMLQDAGNRSLQLRISNHLTLLRCNTADVDGTAMLTDGPYELQIIEGLEEVLIVDLQHAIGQILWCDPNVLIVVAHLMCMRVQPAVWSDDTVAVEVMIAGRIASIVTTVGKDLLTRQLALVA